MASAREATSEVDIELNDEAETRFEKDASGEESPQESCPDGGRNCSAVLRSSRVGLLVQPALA